MNGNFGGMGKDSGCVAALQQGMPAQMTDSHPGWLNFWW